MMNSTFKRVGGVFLLLMISFIVTAQEFHFREGFNYKCVVAEDSVPGGWTTYNTFASNKTNHGLYTTPDANDRSIRLKDGGSWVATIPVNKAGALKAWVLITPTSDGTEVMHVS